MGCRLAPHAGKGLRVKKALALNRHRGKVQPAGCKDAGCRMGIATRQTTRLPGRGKKYGRSDHMSYECDYHRGLGFEAACSDCCAALLPALPGPAVFVGIFQELAKLPETADPDDIADAIENGTGDTTDPTVFLAAGAGEMDGVWNVSATGGMFLSGACVVVRARRRDGLTGVAYLCV